MASKKLLIGGAGFSGAVVARLLAEAGHNCEVLEQRSGVGGNCHTYRCKTSGILVHSYGPHIFHTDDKEVWDFINSHGEMMPYRHRVFTNYNNQIYSLPVNLHTINQFFNKNFSPKEAKAHIESLVEKPSSGSATPQTFEEQGLAFVGRELYEAFLEGYTLKQWGRSPNDLPASILKRLPVRFIYDDNYFFHQYQGIPREGYTPIIESILAHPNIKLRLNEELKNQHGDSYDHIFFSGTLDGWFNYSKGRLAYRTLNFEEFRVKGDFQGCAVMNYSNKEVEFTRITEHKHFAPWEEHEETICFREFSSECGVGDVSYYPVRLVNDKALLADYVDLARAESKVSFLGRLGTYRYLDMDLTIREAMNAAHTVLECLEQGKDIPSFFVEI